MYVILFAYLKSLAFISSDDVYAKFTEIKRLFRVMISQRYSEGD
jgi:hypothetical protein